MILATGSIFLPYILAGIVLVLLAIYVVLNKHTRNLMLSYKDSKIMILFLFIILIIPCLFRDGIGITIGVSVGVGMLLAVILGLFLGRVMTPVLYEKILTLICILSLISTSCAISEKFVISVFDESYSINRISAMFFHPNYFGTIIATVIIICAYKVLTNQGRKWFYYMIAFMNVISLYLCESMFAWIEIFVGVAVLLMILKKHRLLAIWFLALVVGAFTIFVLNIDFIPRLSDAEVTTKLRLKIWEFAVGQIKLSPFIGYGLMSYAYKSYCSGQIISHAHSLYLDVFMNFGMIGTFVFVWFLAKYYTSVFKVCFHEKTHMITSLILAVTAAALVHGLIDVTLMWIQTLPLFLIIISGFGAYIHPKRTK